MEAYFGPTQYDCARVQLFKLTQQGLYNEYVKAFLALANRSEEVIEGSLIDCFVGGLKPEIRREVVTQMLSTLLKAVALRRLYADKENISIIPSRLQTMYSPSPTVGVGKSPIPVGSSTTIMF